MKRLCVLLGIGLCTFGAHAEKTFVFCAEEGPKIFNPQLATDGPTFNATSRMLYSRLVDFAAGTTKIIPSLAESWTISKDGKTYTFKLRHGVTFSAQADFVPTRPFNAEDVLFTFNRMRDKSHPYHSVNGGNYEYFTAMKLGETIKEIVKKDDHTVQFVLAQAESPFLADLGMDFASILSAEYATYLSQKKTPDKIDLEPVGTGPFVLKSYVKDDTIRYEARPGYFGGPPAVDKVIFAITKDASVRMQKLKAGECHFAAEPSPQDLKSVANNSSIQILHETGLNVGYLAFNTQKKPLDNVKVRQAITLGLNRQAYIDAIYLGQATLAVGPLPPNMLGATAKLVSAEYNPEKARSLLKEAGYAQGFEIELWTLPVSRPYIPSGKKLGELMQADLAKIGIKVKLVSYDWSKYLEESRKGKHQLIQLGWTGDNGDPDNFLGVLLSCAGVEAGSNVARWCNLKFEQLIVKARAVSGAKERAQLYGEALRIFKNELPWVPLVHADVFKALSKKVSGYKVSPLGTENFSQVVIQQ